MPRTKGLGKGLSALISEQAVPQAENTFVVTDILIDEIEANPYQPRKHFSTEALQELAASIQQYGIVQPILVRGQPGKYQLIAGERRLRAARMVGQRTVPALIRTVNDSEMMELALVENLQRHDLNPMEEAQAYYRLVEEFHWTQETIGERVGKSRSHIANYLRLLQLEPEIQKWIADALLSMAHAKLLLQIPGPRRLDVARRAIQLGWTVRQLQQRLDEPISPPTASSTPDVHLSMVEAGLRRRFGSKVVLRGDGKKGRIEIPYASLDELERLLELLNGSTEAPSDFVV